MIVTTKMLIDRYGDYANPKCKIKRAVERGEYRKIVRGFYETEPDASGEFLAGFNGPSYLSFQYALYEHGIIPETVYEYTSATTNRRKTKRFKTPFGVYSYRDVPPAVFRYGVELRTIGDRSYWLAQPVKAVCDQLYSLPPVSNMKEMEYLVFEDQRMDYDSVMALNTEEVSFLAERYVSRNVTMFDGLLRRLKR